MKLDEWLKWRIAPEEMEELERWRIQWHEHRRWFAEFPVAAVTLDRLKAKANGEPVTSIHVVRDSCRSAGVEQVFVSRELIELNQELLAALEKLARLGNGEHYGNSDGNMIARVAIAKGETK